MRQRSRASAKSAAELWASLADVIHLTYRKVTKTQIASAEKALRGLLALALVACCGERAPVLAPGQVVVAGDTTFRGRDGDAIEVTTARRLDGHDATGVATLHGMSLDAARRSPLVNVAAARAWLAIER